MRWFGTKLDPAQKPTAASVRLQEIRRERFELMNRLMAQREIAVRAITQKNRLAVMLNHYEVQLENLEDGSSAVERQRQIVVRMRDDYAEAHAHVETVKADIKAFETWVREREFGYMRELASMGIDDGALQHEEERIRSLRGSAVEAEATGRANLFIALQREIQEAESFYEKLRKIKNESSNDAKGM